MSIITISRQFGSLGDEIARSVSEAMGYRLLDREGFEGILREQGLDVEELLRYDERKPSFWQTFAGQRERYLNTLKLAVYESVLSGSGVVLGRGGMVLLGDIPGALHVRIVTPRDLRVERISRHFGCSRKEAEHRLHHSEQDRAGFHRFFFNVDWDADERYHMVLNTRDLSTAEAAVIIRQAVKLHDKPELHAAAALRLQDRLLAQRITNTILYEKEIPVNMLQVTIEDGVAELKGSVDSRPNIEACEEAARSVEGVREVRNEIFYLAHLYSAPQTEADRLL